MDVGGHLRRAREAHGISLASLAARTRVQPRILAAIEANDLHGIPPKPFGRGFVRAFAHEVGLDPEQVVHDFFGQFAPPIPPADAEPPQPVRRPVEVPQWIVPAVLAVIVIVGAMVLLRGDRQAASDPPARDSIGTTGSAAPPSATLPVAAPAPVTPDRITLTIRADRDCWIAASADGDRVMYQILPAGSERTLEGTREIVLRAGDAGALRLTLNGRDVGTFGQAGEVRQVQITPDNVETFAASHRR